MGQKMKLHFDSASLSDVKDLNASFASGRLDVMYTGDNRNGSSFPQEVVEAALPSISNIPIVAHYDMDANEIGSHDMEVVRDGDTIRLRNLTEPCGVVPESATASFEEKADDNGVMHNYLTINPVILWKRQEVYRHITEDLDGKVDHSMEVNITAFHKDEKDGPLVVDAFEFEALCLLESAEPCYEGSMLEVFDAGGFKAQMAEMMQELRETFAAINAPETEIDIQNGNKEGGRVLDEKLELLAQYGLEADKLDFSLDDFSVEELREKFEAMKGNGDQDKEPKAPEAFELASNMRKVLQDALQERTITKPWGPECEYWFDDYDQENGMVYAESTRDWNVYGFPFTMDGDTPKIDFDAGRRVKRAYVDFDGGTQPDNLAIMFENIDRQFAEMEQKNKDAYAELQEKFNALTEDTADIEELREFKKKADDKEREDKVNAVFENFEDLNGNEEFEKLREDNHDLSIEALEEKCYALRGRYGTVAKFSMKEKTPKIRVTKEEKAQKEPYGGLFRECGPYRNE